MTRGGVDRAEDVHAVGQRGMVRPRRQARYLVGHFATGGAIRGARRLWIGHVASAISLVPSTCSSCGPAVYPVPACG